VCNETLVDLRIGRDGFTPLRWPPKDTPPLPALQVLHFRDIKLDPDWMGEWLHDLKRLEEFVVRGGKRVANSPCWQPFSTAIRDHPNKLAVELSRLRVGDDDFVQENSHVDLNLPDAEENCGFRRLTPMHRLTDRCQICIDLWLFTF